MLKTTVKMNAKVSFFLIGFIILSGDFIWMLLSTVRFLPFYPDNLFLCLSVLGRDAVGMLLCFLLTHDKMDKVLQFSQRTVLAYGFLILFLGFHFLIAETPAWTDYTFAIRQGYSFDFILSSFIATWIGGKVVTVLLVWSWLKR